MKKVTHQLNVRRVKNLSRPGELNFSEALESLNEDLVIHAVEDLLEDLTAMEVDENLIEQLASSIDGIIANLPELLKRYIEQEMALQRTQVAPVEPLHSAYDYRFSESKAGKWRKSCAGCADGCGS